MPEREHHMLASPPGAFRRAQWRMLLATMFCYLFYYTGRQTIGFAIPGIEAELGLRKDQLGWFSAAMFVELCAGTGGSTATWLTGSEAAG